MTVGDFSTDNQLTFAQSENGFTTKEPNQYKAVLKQLKAHDRCVVGIKLFQNRRTRQTTLISIGHDALKLWTIFAKTEDEFELIPLRQINRWNCGVQSYSVSNEGKLISLVGTEATLYHIDLEQFPAKEPRIYEVQKGIMEIWHLRSTLGSDLQQQQFLTVNFHIGQLQILNMAGEVINAVHFEKSRHVSAFEIGKNYAAIGSSQGMIFVASASTLCTLYSVEGHSMKVRCLTFVDDDKLLSGSDDKTIKLFNLTESRANLLRVFCGHKGIVTDLAICHASKGERFASSGTDNCIILWSLEDGQKLHVFCQCAGSVNDVPRCLQFSPNGQFLVAGTDDSNILAFRVPHPPKYTEEDLEPIGGEEDELNGQPMETSASNWEVVDEEEEEGHEGEEPAHWMGSDGSPGQPMDDDNSSKSPHPLPRQQTPTENEEGERGQDEEQPRGVDSDDLDRHQLEMELGID